MTEVAVALEPTGPPIVIDDAAWQRVMDLKCALSIEIPLPGLKICNWLTLQRDTVIDAHWPVGSDVPLRANGVVIAWAEFDVVGDRLAVRLTELA